MSISITYRVAGPTAALSVANTQHATVAVLSASDAISNGALFINRGATDVCVVTAPLAGYPSAPVAASPTTPALVFPVDGTPTVPNSFILPAGMTQPMLMATPASGFAVSAIGSAAGPSIIYITPVALQ